MDYRLWTTMLSLYKKAYSGLSSSTWLLSVVLLINRSGTMVIPFMTVYLTQRLHFSIEQAGLVMACYGIGAISGALVGGRLTDKIGFYPVQFWSLFLNGILFMVLGQMRTMAQISICIFIMSLVGEAFRPANSTAIAYYSSVANRTRSYSLNRLAVNLGWSLGPALGGILASISYHLLFWVDGLSCITAALVMRIFLPPSRALQPRDENVAAAPVAAGGTSVYKDGIYLVFIVLTTLFASGFFQLSSIVPLFYKRELHLNEAYIGLSIGINGLLIALVEMILVYKLDGKKHSLVYITWGALLAALAYLSFHLPLSPMALPLVFCLLFTFGEMLVLPFMNAFWISRSAENNRGQYAALYTIAYSTANVVAPTSGAYMVDHFGFYTWWYVAAGICFVTAIGFYLLRRRLASQSTVHGPQSTVLE